MKKSKKTINEELCIIHSLFPGETTELNWETPFQLLIAVILSAQCTDKQVNKVTSKLFQIIKSPQDIILLGQNNLEQAIKSIGFYRAKANNIYKTALILQNSITDIKQQKRKKEKEYHATYGYLIPKSTKELTILPGVGIKTAKVVSHVLYGSGEIAVDTHVHRVCNRLGWVRTKTPEQTSKLLEHLVYQKNKHVAHHSMVLFGRYHCTARKPKCETCPLAIQCAYHKIIHTAKPISRT